MVQDKGFKPDYESYLHRIGRAGRFGAKGIALSLYDNEDDEATLFKIVEHFAMKDQLKPLDGPAHLQKLIGEYKDEL